MTPRVIHAEHIDGFVLRIRFADGTVGEIDFRDELEGEVFEPLKNLDFFRQFSVSPELHTLVWPNHADFAPEFLYERVHAAV
jgi:hypothetical protein